MKTTESQDQAYVPGVCNINPNEVAYRRKAAYIGAITAILLLALLLIIDAERWFRLALFVPIFVAAIGYLQVKNRFCVSYGASGKQNATGEGMSPEAVTLEGALEADKKKSRKMNIQAAVASLVITILMLILP